MYNIRPFLVLSSTILFTVGPGDANAQTKVVADPDSVLTMEVPAGWVVTDLGGQDATLQMTDSAQAVGLMIIPESKTDFYGWNMTRFLYVTLGMGVGALDMPQLSELQHRAIDGAPAATVRIEGAAGGQQFVYLRAAIDAPKHWLQVILFSPRSAWPVHEEEFRQVIESVDLIGN